LGHFSSNNYRFAPETQRTDFGTAQEAYSFVIYFNGQEQTRFQTMMGGTSLKWAPKEGTNLDFYATVFNTDEREYFDIEGQYFINELETDPSKEELGDSIATLGVGSFLNHARNRLNATIINVYHDGSQILGKKLSADSLKTQRHDLKWGVNFQADQFDDVLSEWRLIDSAGFSLPQGNDEEVELFEVIDVGGGGSQAIAVQGAVDVADLRYSDLQMKDSSVSFDHSSDSWNVGVSGADLNLQVTLPDSASVAPQLLFERLNLDALLSLRAENAQLQTVLTPETIAAGQQPGVLPDLGYRYSRTDNERKTLGQLAF